MKSVTRYKRTQKSRICCPSYLEDGFFVESRNAGRNPKPPTEDVMSEEVARPSGRARLKIYLPAPYKVQVFLFSQGESREPQ